MIHLTPVKTIRAKCLDCTGGQPIEVRLCPCEYCVLWNYHMGARPEHQRAVNANEEAQRENLRAKQEISAPELTQDCCLG